MPAPKKKIEVKPKAVEIPKPIPPETVVSTPFFPAIQTGTLYDNGTEQLRITGFVNETVNFEEGQNLAKNGRVERTSVLRETYFLNYLLRRNYKPVK